ncbi:MAG TPA: YceI family protein [Gemmatimonadaceae bacterium]|jgi:polyisoprenoid-binding protein YceI|nr:YceI family protein [Gemmatimonadaceae bacterium]
MRKTLLTVSALMAATATAGAQGANAVRLRLDPASELTVEGTSSMHAWHCKTDKINAYVDVDPGYTRDLTKVARPITAVQVNIVVKTLSCGNSQMDRNMYSTLKADANQLIKYTLTGYDLLSGSVSPTSFGAKTNGTLTIAGETKPIEMKISAERQSDGKAVASGEQTLLLSDFGIKAPSFMFGTLKVGNEVKVKFTLKAGPELLAQLDALNRAGQ